VRVHGTAKGLAMTTDCTPRYCYADPVEGGKQAVAEAYRNLCAVGARPLAITNCLNFGNPQRPEIMGQFVGCIEGMAEACRALDFPVVSGNVSLYNETKAEDGSSLAILPTPAIGGVGLLDDWEKSATIGFKTSPEGWAHGIWLLGASEKRGSHLGQSAWLQVVHQRAEGPPPDVDLEHERRVGALVRRLIADGLVSAVHDVSDGGLLVTLAEMALAGNIGAAIDPEWLGEWRGSTLIGDVERTKRSLAPQMFGEDQGRYVVTSHDNADQEIPELAKASDIPCIWIGVTGGDDLCVGDCGGGHTFVDIPLADLRAAHEGFFPKLMGRELTPEF
jgi:phosphoribosylformylglycinamidine synthase